MITKMIKPLLSGMILFVGVMLWVIAIPTHNEVLFYIGIYMMMLSLPIGLILMWIEEKKS